LTHITAKDLIVLGFISPLKIATLVIILVKYKSSGFLIRQHLLPTAFTTPSSWSGLQSEVIDMI
jgi:hypothetical protein